MDELEVQKMCRPTLKWANGHVMVLAKCRVVGQSLLRAAVIA